MYLIVQLGEGSSLRLASAWFRGMSVKSLRQVESQFVKMFLLLACLGYI